jgi:hypothetical protein
MNGKIVLGLAATIVTIGSALGLRAHKKQGSNTMVGKTADGHCFKCRSLWSSSGGAPNTKCKTAAAGLVTLHGIGSGRHSHTWYTQTVANDGNHCPSLFIVVRTKTTTSQ